MMNNINPEGSDPITDIKKEYPDHPETLSIRMKSTDSNPSVRDNEAPTMEEEDASNLAKDGNALRFFPCPAWLGLEEKTLPRTAKELRAHTFDSDNKGATIDRIISSYIPKVRKGSLLVRQRQILYDILKTLYTLENIAELPEESIMWVLNGVMGETPNVREPYAFEEPFPTLATMTMERIMPEFGFKEPVGDESTPSPPPTTQAPATRKRKRSQPENSRPIRRRIQDIIDPRIRLMMENIELTESSARKCYKIINKALINPSDQFGKNGLKMGKWWPYRLNALRDGAHGASQGGIYGNQYGAYSIVLSRSYEGLNIDEGNTIYYSGSGSNTNEDPNDPHVSSASRHMRRSMKYSHPVRVLRNSQGNPRWSPSVGIRYDGLYEIVDEEELVNKLGGKFVRFVLVRKRGQNPIQQNRPNPAEKNAFHWLKNSL